MFETIPGLSFETVPCHLKQNARKKQKDKEEWNTVCTLVLIRAVTSATSAIRCQHELSFFVAVRQWTPTCKEGWLTINVIHVHGILHLSLFLSLIFRRHISILCNLCNQVFLSSAKISGQIIVGPVMIVWWMQLYHPRNDARRDLFPSKIGHCVFI